MDAQPMKDSELGQHGCMLNCQHPERGGRMITSAGVWVKQDTGPYGVPGTITSAHRDCYEAWAASEDQGNRRVTYRDKPDGAHDYDVVPGFSPVTWGDLRGN